MAWFVQACIPRIFIDLYIVVLFKDCSMMFLVYSVECESSGALPPR